jgi:nucleotide-binding universal stress UspA family protein
MNSPRPPVVVGVDGSPDAGAAAEYGAWEAEHRRLPLRLVHVHQPPIMYGPSMAAAYGTDEPLRDAQAVLRGAIDALRGQYPGLEVGTVVTAGSPASVLVGESRTAALVVVGARGLGRFEQLLAGSVSAQVATHAHAPVVVLRPAARQEQPSVGSGVVVGVDGSAGSTAALAFAFEEAAARGTELVAVYAWVLPDTREAAEAQQEADRVLAEGIAGWQEKFPEVSVLPRAVRSLNPLATLIDEGAHAQLVVVGPRGRGGFAGLLLGSVSDGLVRHAHRPVAVVHPPIVTRRPRSARSRPPPGR